MREGFKRAAQLLVVLTLTLGLGVAGTPAHASLSDCPSSQVCTWNGKNWSGTPAFHMSAPATFGACMNISPLNGANNNAESLYNRESFQVSFYRDANGSGYMFSLAPGAGESDLSVHPSPGGWQNIASSICHE